MVIYLDNASTSYKRPLQVVDAVNYAIKNLTSHSRGDYKLAVESLEKLALYRENLTCFFNIPDSSNFIFTSGCTHSINQVIKGLQWQKNDYVALSCYEHNSVYRPISYLEKKYEVKSILINENINKCFNFNEIEKIFSENPIRLFAITAASNVTGKILPIKNLIRIAKKYGAKVLIDASQIAGNMKIDIQDMDPDYLVFGSHKYLMGIAGMGGLYCRNISDLEPLVIGGTGINNYENTLTEYFLEDFESGTANLPAIASVDEGIKFINKIGLEKILNHKQNLLSIIFKNLSDKEYIDVYSPENSNVGIFSFNISKMGPEKVAYILNKDYDIAVRSGIHCSPLTHKVLGTFPDGCVRASIGYFNKIDEIKFFIQAIEAIGKRRGKD